MTLRAYENSESEVNVLKENFDMTNAKGLRVNRDKESPCPFRVFS